MLRVSLQLVAVHAVQVYILIHALIQLAFSEGSEVGLGVRVEAVR